MVIFIDGIGQSLRILCACIGMTLLHFIRGTTDILVMQRLISELCHWH